MGRWWDTDMASASQALYTDPSLALETASTPDDVFQGGGFAQNVINYTAAQQEQDKQEVQEKRNGFLGTIADWASGADDFMTDHFGIGWEAVKWTGKAAWYPVDKAAQGAHWLYSEAVSQPLSTLWIQGGKTLMREDVGVFFSGDEWTQAYGEAETQSVGQSIANTMNTVGTAAYLTAHDKEIGDAYRRNYERLVYDTDYWREKGGWRYTAGSGATDFMAVLALDPTTYITAGVGQVVKGVRSIQVVSKGGELVRTRGAIADTARKAVGKKPETIEEISQSKKMNEFYDWIVQPSSITNAPRKTVAEIESHPIWGRGRRTNDFKHQYSQVFAHWNREDFPLAFRFAMGDNSAMAQLSTRGTQALDDLGRLSENRVLVDSAKLDPEMLVYYQERAAGIPETPSTRLFEPPTPRPTTPGPAQRGWDKRWGQLATQSQMHKELAAVSGPIKPIGPAANTASADIVRAQSWKDAKLQMINDEVVRLTDESENLARLLGPNLGRSVEDVSTVGTGFGGLDRAYRMGNGAFRSTTVSAEKKFLNKMKDRRGRFSTDGYRRGFYGTPLRIVQSFGDKTPHGRINHNEADAGDRVFEMLREVPGLDPITRTILLDSYMVAGDKVAKSRALESINHTVLTHMAERVYGLDGEVARAISTMVQGESMRTVQKLLGTTGRKGPVQGQAFSTALRDESAAATQANRVDYVDDGVGYVVAPLAKTQLSQTDTLLPVRELNRVFARNSGALKQFRKSGGSVKDATVMVSDNFSTIWKAATLLRPAYVPRMISEEAALSALKFGFLSRIVGDTSRGAKNFVLNRGQQIGAELGLTSYTPTTGKGVESAFAVVKVGDEDVVQAVKSRQAALKRQISVETDPLKKSTLENELASTKYSRIRVNRALPVVRARIRMEREMMADLEKEMVKHQREYDRIASARSVMYERQTALDTASESLAEAYARTARIRGTITPIRQEISGVAQDVRAIKGIEGQLAPEVAAQANPVGELEDLAAQAAKFADEARRAAGTEAVRWGDQSWKYNAEQLDELTKWQEKTAKILQSQKAKAGGVKSIQKLAESQRKELEGVIGKLTGDKEWWNAALKIAQRNERLAREGLGKAAEKAHYGPIPDANRMTSLRDQIDSLALRIEDHKSVTDEFTEYANEILRVAVASGGRRLGEGTFEAFGYTIPQAFSKAWENSISREQLAQDSQASLGAIYARQEAVDMGRFIKTGSWTSIEPGAANHMDSWLHAINRQFAQDDVFNLVMQDSSGAKALAWLATPAGKAHLRDMGIRGRDPQKLVDDITITLDKYLPEDTGLRTKLLEGKEITAADLESAIAKDHFPTVHGEEIAEKAGLTAKHSAPNVLDRMIEKGFQRLGAIPSEVMSRNPVYLRFQEGRYKEILGRELDYRRSVGREEALTPGELEKILHESDKLARKDMSKIVYDPQRP